MNYSKIKFHEKDGVCYISAPNQYLLCDMFMRIQEFYESALPKIRNHYFTREEFCDEYAKKYKKFKYHTEWVGFNVPGHIVKKFFKTFHDLSKKEIYLQKLLKDRLNSSEKFYLIGITDGDEVATNHELAHAKYYLDENYKKAMSKIIDELPKKVRKKIIRLIIKMKYDKSVAYDEIQAYFSTSKYSELKMFFGTLIKRKTMKKFRIIYRYW